MSLVLSCAPLLALLAVAVVTDVRRGRIPNWLTLTIACTGLANALVFGAPAPIDAAVLGLLAGFGLLILPWLLGAIGGGDVKMLAGIGAWLGLWATLQVYAVTCIAAMLIAIVQAAATGRLTRLFSNSTLIVANFANYAQLGRDHVVASGQSLRSIARPLPWAVPALIGVVVTLAMHLI